MLDRRIRSREEETLFPGVAPADHVRRSPVRSVHLEDFSVAVRLAKAMALDDDAVTDGRLHETLLLPLLLCFGHVLPPPTIGPRSAFE